MTRLFGLVLSGGKSTRMGRDKGSLIYTRGMSQRERGLELLSPFCERVFISCRREQDPLLPEGMPRIHDELDDVGPAAGLLAAWSAHPVAWLVLACDFPYCTEATIARLVSERSLEHAATAYACDASIEPLFAIWEPAALKALADDLGAGQYSPSRTLARLRVKLVSPEDRLPLQNVNSLRIHLELEQRSIRVVAKVTPSASEGDAGPRGAVGASKEGGPTRKEL